MPNIIEIDGIIGWDVLPGEVSAQLKKFKGQPVQILFSSDGGFISDGLAIFNHIHDYPGVTTAIIIGMAASMSSYIPLAADKVIAKSNAVMMIHDPLMGIYGNQREHEKAAKILGGFANMLSDIYAKKTGKSLMEVRDIMDKETYFFGSEMFEAGLVDEIDEIEINVREKDDAVLDAMLKFEVAAKRIKTRPEDFSKIAAYIPGVKNMSKIIAGESLGAFLNREIDKKAGDDQDERQSIISEIATDAGIEVGTVNQILSGSIICPPISRLRAFSRVLDITISSITDAAENDGCSYNEEEDSMACNIKQDTEPVKSSASMKRPSEVEFMDINQLETGHRDVYEAVIDRGKSAGILLERKRMNDIDALGIPVEFAKTAKESNLTAERVAANYLKEQSRALKAKKDDLEADLNDPLASDSPELPKEPKAEAKNPVADYNAAVLKAQDGGKVSKGEAMKYVKNSQPELHTAFIENQNQGGK